MKTIFGGHTAARTYPGDGLQPNLNQQESQHSIGLMRVNNVGEVCAQALYQGQSLATANKNLALKLNEAAIEEIDHLAWTKQRLDELGGKVSLFNPLWYASSFAIGYIAGTLGDQWSLGFLAETEYQVAQHLVDYMQKLPQQDQRSHAILQQMYNDEIEHAEMAVAEGGQELPQIAKYIMQTLAKVMKFISYKK